MLKSPAPSTSAGCRVVEVAGANRSLPGDKKTGQNLSWPETSAISSGVFILEN
jgi:hypothetical protein